MSLDTRPPALGSLVVAEEKREKVHSAGKGQPTHTRERNRVTAPLISSPRWESFVLSIWRAVKSSPHKLLPHTWLLAGRTGQGTACLNAQHDGRREQSNLDAFFTPSTLYEFSDFSSVQYTNLTGTETCCGVEPGTKSYER